MQYPLRDSNSLKGLLSGTDDVLFVENMDNFREALTGENYEDYFVDKFAGNFGHATLKGNKLIAKNLADNIIKELELNEK
jgi:hypothetical protein